MKLKIKKIFSDALLPVRSNPTDSGADVFVYKFEKFFGVGLESTIDPNQKTLFLKPNERVLVNTGLTGTVGPGYEIQIRPRSGNALKKGLTVLNTPGTIDESYRGPLCVIVVNLDSQTQKINVGDKIAQLVVCPVILSEIIEVKELDDTNRGANGFGSTG